MFTGLVTAVGTITAVHDRDDGRGITVRTPWDDVAPGESIAVDGACLTATTVSGPEVTFHVITTTLERTALGRHAAGRRVNLERALRASDRLGGHLVQGHVDGVGTVRDVRSHGDAVLLDLDVPPPVAAASVHLGSITVDGVSLTVNALDGHVVQVSLIPFTLEHTTLGERRPGDPVHVEGDTVGKYVRSMLERRGGAS